MKRTGVEVVNWFYEVQDWLIEFVLASQGTYDMVPVPLKDDFGLGIPFVAMAISSLFKFLDSVAGVVDVDFHLPNVRVFGVECNREQYPLHPCVMILPGNIPQACVVSPDVIATGCACVPTPAHSAGQIKFRDNLPLHEIHDKLQYIAANVFGYEKGTWRFQDRVLNRIFDARDVLGIAATGHGKSLCFWLPGLLKPGLTLVVCPLRSLMRDQRLGLRRLGIASADFINVDVDKGEQRRILHEAKLGYIRLLYISPERLRIKSFREELEGLQAFVPINFFAVDEAHCISEWGHDFRPSYLKLPIVREALSERNPGLQLIALTATAGQMVEADIRAILRLSEEDVERNDSVDRPSFSYEMIAAKDGATKSMAFREVLTEHLHKALRKPSLPSLLAEGERGALRTPGNDGRLKREKSVGIVFCIYADPHGRHSTHDGTAHYLFETMSVLEPEQNFKAKRGDLARLRTEAFSTGRVRVYSSKPPTLCPRCGHYDYISKGMMSIVDDETEGSADDDVSQPLPKGRKICLLCGHEFDGEKALSPPGWPHLIRKNQDDFKRSELDVLVATKGFGMGIDKSSVRFVVHTSLSSGLESWYQEVGRAGRDEKRAHIVLLVDPPNDACRKELATSGRPQPKCKSYRGGCPLGRTTMCDYGKQHMFISASYPGAESDAKIALRFLAGLMRARQEQRNGPVTVNTSNTSISRHELAIHRLVVLGLITDYAVHYRQNPRFDVACDALEFPRGTAAINTLTETLQEHLRKYFERIPPDHDIHHDLTIQQRLEVVRKPLANDFDGRERTYDESQMAFFCCVYEHLLVLLDHTYTNVLKMRYSMLWNLLSLATSHKCRRVEMLPHLGESRYTPPDEKCGCCDNCCEALDFPENGRTRSEDMADQTRREREDELERMVRHDDFNLRRLWELAEEVADYPTQRFRWARGILEGAPNNLCALLLARRFSPPEELGGDSIRLLATANARKRPLEELEELYRTSSDEFKSNLLLCLNEAFSTCDSVDGWRFVTREAAKLEQHGNQQVASVRECLDFFVMVEDTLPSKVPILKSKANQLKEVFDARND